MSFYQTIRSSLLAIFSASTTDESTQSDAIGLEDIRAVMLQMAGRPTEASAPLLRRIRYAADPQALWFMRSELMALLAHQEGEAMARTKLEVLSDMFGDLLPRGLRSRPSQLFSSREDRVDSQPR